MHPQTILIISTSSALVALVSLLISIVTLSKASRLAKAGRALEGDFEESVAQVGDELDKLSHRSDEHARKVAWLESRARLGRTEPQVVAEMITGTNPKPNITERRHRVLSLARRGQDAQTIAQTLGIPHGEVELMINLLKVA